MFMKNPLGWDTTLRIYLQTKPTTICTSTRATPSEPLYLNFARAVFLNIARDIVTNSRALLTKTKKFESQSDQITHHVASVQRSLAMWI